MTPDSPEAVDVKAAIENLIHSASTYDFSVLEHIYHDDMKIFMIGPEGVVNQSDKIGFIKHVTDATMEAETPHIWSKYHLVEADENDAHVVISRKVNLTGEIQIVTLSIDLTFEDDRWQITREVICTA